MADNLVPGTAIGRIVRVDSSCGCTLTKTAISGLSPDDIVALSTKEIALTKAVLDAKEAKMLGVPERGLMELLTSKVKDIKDELGTTKIDRQSIVMPFIMRQQRSYQNMNYYTIEGGSPTPGAGIGSVPVSAFDFTLNLGPSWLASPTQNIERYFVPGSTLIVLTWDSFTTKNAKTIVYTILAAANADVGGTAKAKVTVYPNVPSATWNTYNSAQKLSYQPTFGVAQTGANSIDDHESYCPVQPADLNNRLIVNWLQTTRESYCRQQSYEETVNLILQGKVNDYLKAFKYLSVAEQQKQQAARYRREWYNSVFYGQAIDAVNQTTSSWQNLPIVYDAVNTTCPMAYKASADGIFTKLNYHNRVVDMAGNRLSMDYIFQQLYYLRRYREADGDSIQVIDCMTDRYTANMILEVMCKYYETRYNLKSYIAYKPGQQITHDGVVLFNYNIYDIPDAGVQLAVFVDDYFNDMLDAFNTQVVGWDFKARARNLWFIDWSDITIGVGATNQVTRHSPDPETNALYRCVIATDVSTYDLRSKMWTVFVDRPQRHLIVYNFSGQCPTISSGYGCVVPQS